MRTNNRDGFIAAAPVQVPTEKNIDAKGLHESLGTKGDDNAGAADFIGVNAKEVTKLTGGFIFWHKKINVLKYFFYLNVKIKKGNSFFTVPSKSHGREPVDEQCPP